MVSRISTNSSRREPLKQGRRSAGAHPTDRCVWSESGERNMGEYLPGRCLGHGLNARISEYKIR